ncbi:SMI1/KNR4 family protein [Paenibacillus oryzisoli]|uniref:SMI1/KNR4 family protein n=1 Tax=Paenibacillus oryzisoli TaxID=1850517 RepID=UPI003D2A841B
MRENKHSIDEDPNATVKEVYQQAGKMMDVLDCQVLKLYLMEANRLLERIRDLQRKMEQITGVTIRSLNISPVVDRDIIKKIEQEIPIEVPHQLKEFYLRHASSVDFRWSAEPSVFGVDCKRGELNVLPPMMVLNVYRDMMEIVNEGRTNQREFNENAGVRALVNDWPYWLPFCSFANGDAFCIDARNQKIVFLEHDVMDGGPYIHGTKIAENIYELLERWIQIAFVDVYDWSKVVDDEGINLSNPLLEPLLQKIK